MAQNRVGEKAVQAAHKTPPRPRYLRTTQIQLIVMFIGLPMAYLFAGLPATVALASGAACSMLPQAYFALRMSRAGSLSAERAARMGLTAEAGKFALSAAGFALVFALIRPERPGLVFAGFGCFWVIQIYAGIRLLRQPQAGR